jgi:hypothetical protein
MYTTIFKYNECPICHTQVQGPGSVKKSRIMESCLTAYERLRLAHSTVAAPVAAPVAVAAGSVVAVAQRELPGGGEEEGGGAVALPLPLSAAETVVALPAVNPDSTLCSSGGVANPVMGDDTRVADDDNYNDCDGGGNGDCEEETEPVEPQQQLHDQEEDEEQDEEDKVEEGEEEEVYEGGKFVGDTYAAMHLQLQGQH